MIGLAILSATMAVVTEAPLLVPATRVEIGMACRLAPGFHARLRALRARSVVERDKRLALTRALPWHELPNRARCGSRTVAFRPGGSGDFVTDIALSGDGRLVGLRGGWQAGKRAGAVGDCFYQRVGARLISQGCVQLGGS